MTGGRVVLYRRVSALMGRSGDDFHSPEMQTDAMRRHITPLGLRVVAQYEDIDVSGRTFNREGLDKVRDRVEAGDVDAVAVYNLSRLGRNAGEALRFVKWLRSKKVAIISTAEKIDDTPEGQLALTMFFAIAELMSNQIGKGWSEVIERRARLGIAHASTPPMGYRKDGKRIVPDPVTGPAVAAAMRSYATGGLVEQIRTQLGEATGRKPSAPTVRRIMWNPVYIGQVALYRRDKNKNFNWRTEPVFVGPATHEPLIDQETFDACLRRLRRDSHTAPRLLAPRHSLAGIVVCSKCGTGLGIQKESRYGKIVRRLRCQKQLGGRHQDDCTGIGRPRHDEIEQAVLAQVRERIAKLTADLGKARREIAPKEPATALAALTTRKRDVEGRTVRLVERWLDGKVPDSAYETMVGKLREEESAVRGQLEALEAQEPAVPAAEMVAAGEKLMALWPDAEDHERRAMLEPLVELVSVRPAAIYREAATSRVKVKFREPG